MRGEKMVTTDIDKPLRNLAVKERQEIKWNLTGIEWGQERIFLRLE